MVQYIRKDTLVREIEARMQKLLPMVGFATTPKGASMQAASEELKHILFFLDTLEVKGVDLESKIWHDKNTVPKYNLKGVTDFIVSSCYGHIEGVAHSYTPEQWSAHLGFEANREFRWAYEKDLIEMCDYDRPE